MCTAEKCQRRFERGPNVAVRRGTSIFFPTSEERGVLPVGFGLLPPGTVLPDSGLGLRGAGEAVTRAGNAPRRQPQVPLLYRGLYSGSPEPISSAILPEAGVPDGEQTSESAELAGQIELHARQCKRGRPSAAWQQANPGYWKGRRKRSGVLRESLIVQPPANQGGIAPDISPVLREILNMQDPLMVGLIAHLTGSSYVEDIAAAANRLSARGQALLGETTKTNADRKTNPERGARAPCAGPI